MRQQVRNLLILALVFSLLLPIAAKPHAKPPAKVVSPAQRDIQAIYDKIDAAMANKDVDTVFDFNTDDSTFYDIQGHQEDVAGSRQEALDLLQYVDIYQRKTVITSFSSTDTDATVTVKCRGRQSTTNNINGRAIKAVIDESYRDYWVMTDDGWRRKISRTLSLKANIHKNF